MAQSRFHGLVVALVAGTVLLVNLGGPALWDDDEPKNAACSLEMLEANDWVVPTFNGRLRVEKPPLVNWLQIAGYSLCGRNETGARIASALLTLGTCLLTWRIGCLLFRPSVGLLGGLAMASCVWTAVGGRAATPDAPLLFCTTLALFFFVRDLYRNDPVGGTVRLSRSAACAIGVACGAAVLAKGPVGVVLPLAAFILVACWREARQPDGSWTLSLAGLRLALAGLRLPLIVAAATLVALPWYALVGWRTDGEWLRGFLLVHNVGRFSAPMEGHSGSILYYPMTIAVGLFPWSIVLAATVVHAIGSLRSGGDERRTLSLQILGCWALAWVGGFSCSGTKLPGYIWPAYPALAIATGLFLDDWIRGDASCTRWSRDPARALGIVMRVAWAVLAMAGVGLAVGLPAAALQWSPGSEWLGILGLIPLGGAAVAWRYQSNDHRARSVAVLAVCSCLLVALLASLATHQISRGQGVRSFAADFGAPVEECDWACFWNIPPSLVFYTRSQVAKLDTPEDVVRHLSNRPHARLLIDSRHEHLVTAAIPAGYGVIARVPTLSANQHLVIGPLPSAAPPLALND